MISGYHNGQFFRVSLICTLVFAFFLSGCSLLSTSPSAFEEIIFSETDENYAQAEVIFQAKLPTPIAKNEHLVLEILDDVTGVFFNPTHYQMAMEDDQNFYIRLPLIVGQRVKYRYIRQGAQAVYEYNAQNQQVNYRMLYVNGPLLNQDLISAWSDFAYIGPIGRIRGQLVDQDTNAPLPNMLITAGGMKTISSSDGSFILEGLTPGVHNVVISSLDGAYNTFQQGALIAEEATTPITIPLQKRLMVQVSFEVKTPDGFASNLPLKLATNSYGLGFTEADLGAGSSLISSNLPVFQQVDANFYRLVINLPAGSDFDYKFTFGDGFWNGELDKNGKFVKRTLIVPEQNITVKKEIAEMVHPGNSEVTINLTAPTNTPLTDTISIQLNPFGWMQPLPMVRTGENQWSYTVYNPTHLLGNIEYRFCRNENCNKGYSNSLSNGVFVVTESPQIINNSSNQWHNFGDVLSFANVETGNGVIQPRNGFIAGFELTNQLPQAWKSNIDQGLKNITNTGANWVIYSPTWSITNTNPPLFEPTTGIDYLWPDLQLLTQKISNAQLQPILFPRISNVELTNTFWSQATKNEGWWDSLFDRYHRFMLQNADLAMVTGAYGLIIGDPAMRPAMNGGTLADGTSSFPPENSDEKWIQLIQDIRSRYSGPIIGVLSLPNQNNTIPAWYSQVDGIYVIFTPSLIETSDLSLNALQQQFGSSLDTFIQPIAAEFGKPIIIGIDISSSEKALDGCLSINDSCLIDQYQMLTSYAVDLNLQANIYNAALTECAIRPWISGFISRGFDPSIVVYDQSTSIYGKPAMDNIWFWYHYILNKPS